MSREMIVALTCVVVAICMTLFTVLSYLKDATLEDIRADAYKLFLKAENGFKGSGKGKEKMEWVFCAINSVIPNWLRLFISEDMIKELLQTWFDNIKDLLDDGKINKSTEV
jgi:hypothetical protein